MDACLGVQTGTDACKSHDVSDAEDAQALVHACQFLHDQVNAYHGLNIIITRTRSYIIENASQI
jgi:hypothetical protein